MTLNKGEIEVIVLQKTTFNGPDHKSLGELNPGDRVITAAGPYADWLIENSFAALPDDFLGFNSDATELDVAIAAAEAEGFPSVVDEPVFSTVVEPVSEPTAPKVKAEPKPIGRNRNQA